LRESIRSPWAPRAASGILCRLMAESIQAKAQASSGPVAEVGANTLDRLASFRIVYLAIFVFAAVYVVSLDATEILLQRHFQHEVDGVLPVSPMEGPLTLQIQQRIDDLLNSSPWVQLGEVRVRIRVDGADGAPLYHDDRRIPALLNFDPFPSVDELIRLLPLSAAVDVSVPPTGVLAMAILMGYGTLLIGALFFYNRAVNARENRLLQAALIDRDAMAKRTETIGKEIEEVRQRLGKIEPSERAQAEEIRTLQRDRQALRAKLSELEDREAELRRSTARSVELDQERQALEELLEEASDDLSGKEEEIRGLQERLKNAASTPSGGRARGVEQLARRIRTLYKMIECDDRAIQDLVALRDETMKLKAEEGIKRLADDSELASIRRKVGGLPPHLSVFELGFAGKGRIYYTRGRALRYRVLLIGAKNSQKTDLEYLSRISTG
jgi:hypothetical protein